MGREGRRRQGRNNKAIWDKLCWLDGAIARVFKEMAF